MAKRTVWPAYLFSLAMVGAPAVAQNAQGEDDATRILADCGHPGLDSAALDSCLERVRVMEETTPSSQLQSLEADLERRELHSSDPGGTQNGRNAAPPPEGEDASAGDSPDTLRRVDAPKPDATDDSSERVGSGSSDKPATDPYDEPPANPAAEDEPPGI